MNRIVFYFALTVAFMNPAALAGEIKAVTWKTTHAADPPILNSKQGDLLPLFSLGASALAESNAMALTVFGGKALGLKPGQAEALHTLVAARYQAIDNDPRFADTPSALSYCYSVKKPRSGFATVYQPEKANDQTPAIVFLHGYGGSFQFYLHVLAEALPDHLIICPAFGFSCAQIPSAYLDECLRAVESSLSITLAKPVLAGLSARVFGGFREFARQPHRYRGYLCLAAFPPPDSVDALRPETPIRILAGQREAFVTNGTLGEEIIRLRRREIDCQSFLIPDSGHFFLLSEPEKSSTLIAKLVEEIETYRQLNR